MPPARRTSKKTAAPRKRTAKPKPPAFDGPEGLDARGRALWTDVRAAGAGQDPQSRLLLEEACRVADRLERLDAIIRGAADDWLSFPLDTDLAEVRVVLNAPLVEARQQEGALVRLLTPLMSTAAAPTKKEAPSRADEIAAARARRIANPARP